ncbi:MAG TPA: T9SS type A sorting domain-containing protein [Ignavibacteria bacterium]|nr:T9SS type A sorting domain-containing protein [Ignavibacteria bacterium]HMR41216.1 T9SS type A sorting domain-containing protein [Ignavibacteria bacterium]
MKIFLLIFSSLFLFTLNISKADTDPYTIELEQINIQDAPAIQSFAFAQSEGKWLFIGGRINGLHGFSASNSFPKQFSNKYIYVIDPNTNQVWSRSIFPDLPVAQADQFRSTNMEYTQVGNKLFYIGGYGYDSTSNSLLTFPQLKVIDVNETINAVINGTSIAPYVRTLTDTRMQVCGGELHKLGDYFYLAGGHIFTGPYRITVNNQVYTNQIRKFKIDDNGVSVSISDFNAYTDTAEYHRRDMNLVPGIKPGGASEYLALYGGVFKYNIDLPFQNPVIIDELGITVDYSFEQKMSQYTCSYMTLYNNTDQKMHTTFFGGTSLYYFDSLTNSLKADSLVPFIKDITTLTKFPDGTYEEKVLNVKFPALLGTNAKFILNESVPHFDNGVMKLDQIIGRTFAGYIFGGIKADLPNLGPSTASDYIYKVYITPDVPLPVELTSFTSSAGGRNVLLNWSTSYETNNYGFEIERKNSEDNSNWIKAGSVRGFGNSTLSQNYSFEDKELNSGRYNYRLKQIDFNGSFEYFNLTGDVNIGIPEKYYLSQNYPNPFNPSTVIKYSLPENENILIKVFDVTGKEVMTLVNEKQNAGYYSIEFSGRDLSSGVYFYSLITGENANTIDTKRMILVK